MRVFWTDGSALPSGACAAAVACFTGPKKREGEDDTGRVYIRRRAIPRPGAERGTLRRTYGEKVKSVREEGGSGGWRVEPWSLGGPPSAFDAEVADLVRAIEICALEAEEMPTSRLSWSRVTQEYPEMSLQIAGLLTKLGERTG